MEAAIHAMEMINNRINDLETAAAYLQVEAPYSSQNAVAEYTRVCRQWVTGSQQREKVSRCCYSVQRRGPMKRHFCTSICEVHKWMRGLALLYAIWVCGSRRFIEKGKEWSCPIDVDSLSDVTNSDDEVDIIENQIYRVQPNVRPSTQGSRSRPSDSKLTLFIRSSTELRFSRISLNMFATPKSLYALANHLGWSGENHGASKQSTVHFRLWNLQAGCASFGGKPMLDESTTREQSRIALYKGCGTTSNNFIMTFIFSVISNWRSLCYTYYATRIDTLSLAYHIKSAGEIVTFGSPTISNNRETNKQRFR
ncbi:hypothetical protein MPTK1_5g22380 [Marchantia polymorpha subsp. ruderalis]|uniref:Uncharacterized protein n=2 Tax=Marchantia polymorpha TaxID=3197 RepID=A0AAF6BL38_MARPO|nr:hypothetical protein MARPO_0010s0219 [Marchantia polymorpha]BBN12722.1 hypothetical protein Mp_5g22380 [Marchantia polymorpha subsp. ruderalis]|eukprot:PTQ46859.1 hypothetical protein MARPO_0010s0219 [Marchantia polymorpha]